MPGYDQDEYGRPKVNRLARLLGQRWFLMNLAHQVGAGTNPLNPNNTVGALREGAEHGELGALQRFDPGMGLGGRIAYKPTDSEPSSTARTLDQLWFTEELLRTTRGF